MTTTPNPAVHPAVAVAVIGGTRHTGRRVADRLRARGLDVRIGSRSFSCEMPETCASMPHGGTAAYLAYTPDFEESPEEMSS